MSLKIVVYFFILMKIIISVINITTHFWQTRFLFCKYLLWAFNLKSILVWINCINGLLQSKRAEIYHLKQLTMHTVISKISALVMNMKPGKFHNKINVSWEVLNIFPLFKKLFYNLNIVIQNRVKLDHPKLEKWLI